MIYAGRFENDDDNAALLEQFKGVSNIGVRYSNERFGVERIEITMAARGPYDAYQRYRDHQGQRLAIYSTMLSRPISGWITGVEWLGGNQMKYIAKGPHERFKDIPDTTDYTAAQTVTDAITNILGDFVLIDDGTTDNIVTNSTALNGWQPNLPQGGYPLDEIPELLAMSDSSNRVYDFIMVDQPMNGTSLRKFTPYYTYRETDAAPTWIVRRKDLRGAPNLIRAIDGFATTARVWYGLVQGTATSGSDTILADTNKNFIVAGVAPDDQINNITRGGRGKVTNVTSTSLTIECPSYYRGTATGGSTTTLVDTEIDFTTIASVNDVVYNDKDDSRGVVTAVATNTLTIGGAMSGSKSNDAGESYRLVTPFATSDAYSIKTKAQTKYREASTSTTPFWARTRSVFESAMDGDQALQYATILADTEARQTQSVVIGSRFVRDANGALWHPLEMVARGGGYLQIADLFPYAALSSTSSDRLTTFKITSMNWDNTSYTMSVGLDSPDNSLDSNLRRANILNSEMIKRQS